MITVAFIDDGINPRHVPPSVRYESFRAENGGVMVSGTAEADDMTHGTACYTVFRDRVKVPYALVSIKVLDEGRGDRQNLLAALEWCGVHNVNLVHMSMGSRYFSDIPPLFEAVARLYGRGVVMVGACNNQNTLTVPACLPTVIGVRHCPLEILKDNFLYVPNPYDGIDTMIYTEAVRLSHGNNRHVLMYGGNSMAAPIITARVCEYLAAGCVGTDAVRQRLQADAYRGERICDYRFYKALLKGWQKIDVPVVAVFDETVMQPLIALFVTDAYNAVGFAADVETNLRTAMFRLAHDSWGSDVTWVDQCNLLYNFTQPDIILIRMRCDAMPAVETSEPAIDAFIMRPGQEAAVYKRFGVKESLDANQDAQAIYCALRVLFNGVE